MCMFVAMAGVMLWRSISSAMRRIKASFKDDFNINSLEPYPFHPIKGKSKYNMNMGLRRLDRPNWLTIDRNYLKEHHVRSDLLSIERDRVLHCLASSESACAEVLELVVDHLTMRYPNVFRLRQNRGVQTVTITATGETFQVTRPYGGIHPLEIAARLSMEDLNVLLHSRTDGEYFLYASILPFAQRKLIDNG